MVNSDAVEVHRSDDWIPNCSRAFACWPMMKICRLDRHRL